MKDYPNFYENIAEARYRLQNTLVMYQNEPCIIEAITDNHGDRFRAFIQMLPKTQEDKYIQVTPVQQIPQEHVTFGTAMDEFIKNYPTILRKRLDSKHFDNFRPPAFGMKNNLSNGSVSYIRRRPLRNRQQGTSPQHLSTRSLNLQPTLSAAMRGSPVRSRGRNELFSPSLRACILAEYPSFDEALGVMTDPALVNPGVAFDRHFAVVRGPIGLLFLMYKENAVGVIDDRNLRLSHDFRYLLETVQDLGCFRDINVK
jgi:hypothetical protein